MIEPACLLDPAPGSEAIGEDNSAGRRRNSDNEGSAEAKQQDSVEHTRQKRGEIEQGKNEEDAEHDERRPAGGPDPLPQQRQAGKAEPHQERGVGVG